MWRSRPVLLIVAYLGLLAVSVFGPSPGQAVHDGVSKAHRIEVAARSAMPGTEPDGAHAKLGRDGLVRGLDADDLGNVALFVPFGLLFPLTVPSWRRRTIAVGVVLSATIELAQLALSWRISTARDVLFNGIGTAVGLGLLLLVEAAMRHRPAPAT